MKEAERERERERDAWKEVERLRVRRNAADECVYIPVPGLNGNRDAHYSTVEVISEPASPPSRPCRLRRPAA